MSIVVSMEFDALQWLCKELFRGQETKTDLQLATDFLIVVFF
jgi:hypothetical protein